MPHDSAHKARTWELHEFQLDGRRSVTLRYAINHCPTRPIKRWLVFSNGRSEWIEKYDFLPELLKLPADCGFLTWDHRGQGDSGGKRGSIDNYATYATDAATIIRHVVKDQPYAIICHSMGGMIALYACLMHDLQPQKLVLCSPLLGLYSEQLPSKVLRPFVKVMYQLGFKGIRTGAGRYDKSAFAVNKLTHSIEMFDRIRHSPYRIRSASFGWINATLQATDFVFSPKLLQKFTVPTLIMVGSEERVVDPEAITQWVHAATAASGVDVRLDIIHGARHELLAEIDDYRNNVVTKIKAWLRGFL